LGRSTRALSETLGDADWALLDALPPFLRLPEHDALVVHAGLLPGIPVEAQDPRLLYSIRTIRPDGRGSSRAEDGVLWGSLWPGPELVLFGHHASEGLQRHPHAIGLDTGCVYGGELSACILPGREIRAVAAHATYEPATTRVPVPGADGLSPGEVMAVPLPRGPDGIPREALVLRDHGGELHAYLNRCQHLPIPIDGGSRRYLCDDGQYLLCGTHGAKYRLEDGFCVAGPCSGTSLQPVQLERRGDGYVLRVEVARGATS
jgi:nitrite reductase/ring-hydroxylating ferredoxin subunit